MMKKSKPFLSEKNPLNISLEECEKFSYSFLMPNYWFTWILILLSFLISYMPNFFRSAIGATLGLFIFYTNNKRKNIVKTNLELCFKKMHAEQVKKITKSYFINLGRIFLDLPLLWWKSNKKLQQKCHLVNSHHIDDSLNLNKGVILLAAHSISLDFGGRSISKYPIISMYKPFRNKLLNWFVGKSRSKTSDNVVVYSRENISFKKIIKALKTPIVFYYVGDEDLGKDNSVFHKFFDEEKSTLISIAKIASLSGATVIPCINHFCYTSGKYITSIGEPLKEFPNDNILENAKIINEALESIIMKDLTQYMWSLRLFQTRPDNKVYPYKK